MKAVEPFKSKVVMNEYQMVGGGGMVMGMNHFENSFFSTSFELQKKPTDLNLQV